jgi:arylsulfatase A
VCDEPVCGVDLLPTVCSLLGVQVPRDRAIDGADVSPLFSGRRVTRTAPLYWQYNQAPTPPKVAARLGDWKILATLTAAPKKPTQNIDAEDMRNFKTAELALFELYNVRSDPSETTNLAEAQPERFGEMSEALRKMYHSVRDESPVWPAWTAPPYERDRIRWFKLEDVLPTR